MARRKGKGRKKKPVDLMAPFDDLVKTIKKQRALGLPIDVVVKGSLFLDTQAAEQTAFSVGSLLVERIKGEVQDNPLQPLPETRERRRQYRDAVPGRSPTGGQNKAARYPAGWVPNPATPYGIDSGYLLGALALNVDKGKKDVFAGIPKIRGKAGFVLRRASPLLGGGRQLADAVRETTKLRLTKIISKALRRAFRGTGIRAKVQ